MADRHLIILSFEKKGWMKVCHFGVWVYKSSFYMINCTFFWIEITKNVALLNTTSEKPEPSRKNFCKLSCNRQPPIRRDSVSGWTVGHQFYVSKNPFFSLSEWQVDRFYLTSIISRGIRNAVGQNKNQLCYFLPNIFFALLFSNFYISLFLR